ncbi:MAG: alpha-N-acetylglucosaminidase C-terminal domain-containing protein [Bacteroidaceae bacterium]|nr:alpha-N-acetylglucosaminidase C-terminal domain-containing protein [Bacteroidaceae bacterium]
MNIKNMYRVLLLLFAFVAQIAWAQAPVATPTEAITGLLNRIGGNGAANKFEIVIDANLAENGNDVFVITSQNGKPCIKGNTQLSVATGINWYLNHYAHINLTWNNLTTDLSQVTLPVPAGEEKHVSSAKYRYDFNTCTFSYSMAFWTWERWQQEIDWMALHGVNAPLNLVGLDVVTRKFLQELEVSDSDINAYIAGPGFIAWFAMNNLEGWGGTINSSNTGVQMNGNPDWWYTRQEQLCRNMLQRMRELGMQPVIPGFSGQVPNCIVNYSINGFSSGDVVNNGTWAGGYTRPDILKPNTESYRTFAAVYYKHLHEVMGVSELYSIDPFHEGSLPSGVTNATCYPNIMVELDKHFGNVEQSVKDTYKVTQSPSWMIQYWQGVPQSGAFTEMKKADYASRFIGLDLFADNIYADNAAKWRTNYYDTCPYIYCMLHNFGGRSGLHGRLETTMDGYFQALAMNNNCQGIGATPEGTETNPILYDMLFELPWMDSNNRPTADEWLAQYAHARYGVDNVTAPKALEALKNLKNSVWDCKVNQQSTSEAVILARPNWTVSSVSSWSTSAIYWDTQDVLQAADELYAIKDIVTANGGQDGIANYNYDFIDVVRQSMVDYAAQLLPLINAARGNDAEYTRLYQLYLQLMLDLDEMLSYDENFKLERWTSLARNIADEVDGTTENDRNWLEWNARTQVTVWSNGNTDLHDYSNRCWAGLIKDFHYKRWEKFFTTKGGSFDGGWYSGFEYPWTVDFNETYNLAGDYSKVVIPTDMTATEKAAETFGNYFGRVKGATKNYIFPMGVATNATKSGVIPEVYRGKTVELPLIIGKDVEISSVWVDLNNDGAKGNGETLTAANNQVAIPAEATIGKTTAQVVYSDGTDITFSLALIEDITIARTVTAVAGANGSVAIEGTNALSITNTKAVKMTATANTGYNFKDWTDANGNVVSNDNPFIYYGKEAATFTANFIQDKWGVPSEDKSDWGDAAVKTSFVNQLTFAYYNRDPETIYEATVAPDNLFNTIPQIINVPQGASFDISWSDDNNNGLKYCYLSAYYDYDGDGVFELLETKGKRTPELVNDGSNNLSVCEGKINVLLPYDAPLGITHMRLRFDGGWKTQNFDASTKAYDAKAQLNRMCYELIINVTEKSDKAATVNVETNNAEWGSVEVWTDETPDGSTGTSWNVSSNIPMYLRATKTSEDVEFLGWYDHYGRLLTENLEHTMYAREDATYTAKFRKFLEIDGWNIEYRTEPGTEVVTTKLANGVKPEAGKTYYIYAPTNYNSVSATRYLYDNNGTLATNATVAGSNYIWTCIVNEDNTYSFQNASGNYLANDGNYYISIGATPAKYNLEDPTNSGLSLKNAADYNGGKYMVTKHDGSAFNRNSSKTNGEWCSDYVFVEITTPDVVIFTNVRESGNNDLVIPETVDILGEQCKIVGFDNGVFNNNKDLWSITMPKSMEFLSKKSLFSGTMIGTIAPGTGAENTPAHYAISNLEKPIIAAEGFEVVVKGISNGNTFNQWGSGLFATSDYPLGKSYDGGFQFYLAKAGNFVLKVGGNTEDALNNSNCKVVAGKEFTATINYSNNIITITVDNGDGQIGTYTKNCTINNISAFSAAIPQGITLNVSVRTLKEANPFSGCSNLDKIAFDGDCANYYVNGEGDLYNSSDVLVCSPEGKGKISARRELDELIKQMESLTAQVATYDPVGKATEITLSTTEGNDYYIWCNNPHTGDNADARGGVAALLDENPNTYLHTNWSTVSSTYDYLQIDNVNPEDLRNFKIAGQQRADGESDRPKMIEIFGSNNNTDWTPIATVTGLPNTQGGTWTSEALTSGANYAHYKFVVKTYTNENNVGRPYFHMAKFDLFKLTSSATLKDAYAGTSLSANFVAEKYDVLLNTLSIYDNGTAEQMQDAKVALQTAYDELSAALEASKRVTNLSEISNTKVYSISTDRGPIAYISSHSETELSTPKRGSNADIDANATQNAYEQFAILRTDKTAEGKYYLYNLSKKAFININISNEDDVRAVFSATPVAVTSFTATGNVDFPWYIYLNGDYRMNVNAGSGLVLKTNNQATPDEGNRFYLEPIAEDAEATAVALEAVMAQEFLNETPTTVGYPNEEMRTTYQEAIDAHTSVETLTSAKNTFVSTTNINMPENGKAYVIRNVHPNGATYMLTSGYEGDAPQLPTATENPAENNANIFICREATGGYVFVNALHGKYMLFHGKKENNPFSTDGFSQEYSIYNYNILKLSSQASKHFGTLSIAGKRNRLNDEFAGYATMTINKNGSMDANGGEKNASYTDTWSSLFIFEEVAVKDYAINKPTHTPVIKEQNPLLSGIEDNQTISTFSAPYATVMPKGITAYYAQKAYDGNTLYLTAMEEGKALPAGQGVILIGSNEDAAAIVPATTEERAEINEGNNFFKSSAAGDVTMGENDYILANGEQGIGIYKAKKDTKLKAGKAYLSFENAQQAKSFVMQFGGTPTGIENTLLGTPNAHDAIYDLSGRRVNTITKGGLYIVNGKKVFIK